MIENAPQARRVQVWSCGGGTQSAAIAALIVRGQMPKPDLAAMVDTEREKTGTWDYVYGTIKPALAAVGVNLQIICRSDFMTVNDLYSTTGGLLLPVFSTQGGRKGKMTNFCSTEWKKRVLTRWLRAQGVLQCDCWMGISTDEIKRVRNSSALWFQYKYPLVDMALNRKQCVEIVAQMGWPKPPRSSCWMCPNMTNEEWRDMRDAYPTDFEAAVLLEAEVRQKDPHVFLHAARKPLGEVSALLTESPDELPGCDSGFCFV